MSKTLKELADECNGKYLSPDTIVVRWLSKNPHVRELVLDARGFLDFAVSLGNMRGTVYPFQDGGIRFAGATGWCIVKPGP